MSTPSSRYVVERGSPRAPATTPAGTGSGWRASTASTASTRSAAGAADVMATFPSRPGPWTGLGPRDPAHRRLEARVSSRQCLRSETHSLARALSPWPAEESNGDMQSRTVTVGAGPLGLAEVVGVARTTAAGSRSADEPGQQVRATRALIEGLAEDTRAALRHLHRFRCAGDPAHPGRTASPVAAEPDPVPRGGLRGRGRAGGGAGVDVAPHLHARHRSDRCARGDAAGLRRAAERRPHPGGARVRQPRLLRRPGPAGALCAGPAGGGCGA